MTILTAAGIGAHLSGRLPDKPGTVLPRLAGVLTAIVAAYVVTLVAILVYWTGVAGFRQSHRRIQAA